jgi:hypothetical protein
MQTTLKYGEIQRSVIFLNNLLQKDKNKDETGVDLTNKFSLKLFRIHSTLEEEMAVFNKRLEEVKMEYIEKDEDGNPVTETNDDGQDMYKVTDQKELQNALNELYAEDCEIHISMSLDPDELDNQELGLEDYSDFQFLNPFIQ